MEVKKENNRVSLFIDGKMVGFATFPSIGEGVVVINHTMVYPLYQGKGYASKLMEAVVEVYREWIDIVLNKADEKSRAKFLQYHIEIFNGIIDKNMVLMVEAIDKHYDLIETMI